MVQCFVDFVSVVSSLATLLFYSTVTSTSSYRIVPLQCGTVVLTEPHLLPPSNQAGETTDLRPTCFGDSPARLFLVNLPPVVDASSPPDSPSLSSDWVRRHLFSYGSRLCLKKMILSLLYRYGLRVLIDKEDDDTGVDDDWNS